MEASLYNLPNYIIADSPELLRAGMLNVNTRLGSQVKYHFIQQTLDNKWIAWYYEEARIEFTKTVKVVK